MIDLSGSPTIAAVCFVSVVTAKTPTGPSTRRGAMRTGSACAAVVETIATSERH